MVHSYDPEIQTKLELAYLADPTVFDRDATTRRSGARAKLKERTGMDDAQLEGWRIMLERNVTICTSLIPLGAMLTISHTKMPSWRATPLYPSSTSTMSCLVPLRKHLQADPARLVEEAVAEVVVVAGDEAATRGPHRGPERHQRQEAVAAVEAEEVEVEAVVGEEEGITRGREGTRMRLVRGVMIRRWPRWAQAPELGYEMKQEYRRGLGSLEQGRLIASLTVEAVQGAGRALVTDSRAHRCVQGGRMDRLQEQNVVMCMCTVAVMRWRRFTSCVCAARFFAM